MSKARSSPDFLDLEASFRSAETSPVVVLPVPMERTTSYGQGTAHGPQAILEASQQIELYDEELQSEPFRRGIATHPPLVDEGQSTEAYLEQLLAEAQRLMEAGKFVLALGGEHTLTQACYRAALAVHSEVGVVQFDAHADLRDSYEGTPSSHACVMRRIHDSGATSLGVGIRSLSVEEAEYIEKHRLAMIWGWELDSLSPDRMRAYLEGLPDKVYLSFDVDFLDPALVPATGTPEPGGGFWWQTLALLRALFEEKEVVAMDIVELAPLAGQTASDFTVARLAYKCIAYRQAALESSTESSG